MVVFKYISENHCQEEARRLIEAEAVELASARKWWAEPIQFFSKPEQEWLEGRTRICRLEIVSAAGDVYEIDAQDDLFMGYLDVCAIVEQLLCWSEKHHIKWFLELSESSGWIENGVPDKDVYLFLRALEKECRYSSNPERNQTRAQAIWKQIEAVDQETAVVSGEPGS